ncbi:hypothetical protein BTJ49_15305 [Oleiagrimonas sp. MCCC 1A03011]|nr:hypothetical protein BTJ49_15305 [Oleiagrimonas sp. MCCC 1A03011]
MRRLSQETYADKEVGELRELIKTAPGVQRIESIERHPKGGHSITLDFSYEAFDSFFKHVEAQDWMAVL